MLRIINNTCDLTIHQNLFCNFTSFVTETYYNTIYVSSYYNNTYYLYNNTIYCQPSLLSIDGVIHRTVRNLKTCFGHLTTMVYYSSLSYLKHWWYCTYLSCIQCNGIRNFKVFAERSRVRTLTLVPEKSRFPLFSEHKDSWKMGGKWNSWFFGTWRFLRTSWKMKFWFHLLCIPERYV